MLPQWAQRLIEKLESDLAAERWSNAIIADGASDTWVEVHSPEPQTKVFLPKGSVVKFQTKGETFAVYVTQGRQDPERELAVRNSGDGGLVVQPHSSNMIFVRSVP